MMEKKYIYSTSSKYYNIMPHPIIDFDYLKKKKLR